MPERSRPYYYQNTTGSDEHYEQSKNQMGNPSTEESQRQVFSARCDVRSYADAYRFLKEEWGVTPESRSDAIDWCVEVVAQLFQEVTELDRTQSFEEAYDYLEDQGITFEGSDRTKRVKENNLKQESVEALMSSSPKKKEEAKPAANLAAEVDRLRKKHPDWSDNKVVKEAKRNLDIPLKTEQEDNDGPKVTGSSAGYAGIPSNVEAVPEGDEGDDGDEGKEPGQEGDDGSSRSTAEDNPQADA